MQNSNVAPPAFPMSDSTDLIVAFVVQVLVSAGLFALAFRTLRGLKPRIAAGIAAASIVALIAYNALGRDSLIVTRLLPISSALIASDVTLPLAALLAGLLATALPPRRRIFLPGLLLSVAAWQTGRPLMDASPPLRASAPVRGVVRQSSDASCGAASAATLLLSHGIAATEPQMAHLCRTRADGTAMLGIYRGLVRGTAASPFRVATLVGADVKTLCRTAAENGPVVIDVGLPRFSRHPIDPRYESEWGWTPGLRHAVVFFGVLPNGKIDIGDPSTGRESWDKAGLTVLWSGDGIYLKRARALSTLGDH